MHPYIHCSVIYNSQDIEATQVPLNGQVCKKAMLHLYHKILRDHKKE